jgi:hypothetical protein
MLTSYLSIILSLLSTSASPIKRANNQLIVSTRDNLCLSPVGGAAAVSTGQVGNGTPLITMDFNNAAGWDISPGSGSVVLSGTGFAMDAGVPVLIMVYSRYVQAVRPKGGWMMRGNDTDVQTWTSYPGLAAQTWYLTTDGRIAITGGNQCLDEGANGEFPFPCHSLDPPPTYWSCLGSLPLSSRLSSST